IKRGASTITMQLAKNLYLNRDRTLSRKIEEFFLSLYLESSFSKDKILELYLNVVEFAPGVYGIYNGAMHYFGVTPMNLTLKQSLFLTSVLPRPSGSYFNGNNLSSKTNAKLNYLLKIMGNRGKVSEFEVQEALVEKLTRSQ